jgi:hypothetical protein
MFFENKMLIGLFTFYELFFEFLNINFLLLLFFLFLVFIYLLFLIFLFRIDLHCINDFVIDHINLIICLRLSCISPV